MHLEPGNLSIEYRHLRRTLKDERCENARLRRAIRDLVDREDESTAQSPSPSLSVASTGEQILADPLWDARDSVYRCAECHFEVIEGVCQSCGVCHEWDDDAIEEDHDWTIDTGEGMLRGDRLLTARGTTPRIEEGSIDVPDEYLDAEPSREAEFEELVARGATEFMCETFALEFTPETGIVAQVPGEFWDDFPPHFKTQDDWDQEADEVKLWKIYLGRRIVLDDDDPDGSQFIENFLEEVFYYPNKITLEAQWETLLEAPGVWVTRPKDSTMDDDDEIDSNLDDEETRRAYGDAPSEDNRSDHGPEAHMMVDGWECVRVHSAAETSETESDSDDSTQISSTYMEDNARAAQYSSQAESDFEGETMLQTRFVVRRRITRGTRIVSPVPNEDWSA